MSIDGLLSRWRSEPSIGGNIVHWHSIPNRRARYQPLPAELHLELVTKLQAMGIQKLYSHQSMAWEGITSGRSLVVVSGTASGKTLCYNLPVLDRLLRDDESRALYLFPTKALTQDQLDNLRGLELEDIQEAVYDGDTPASARPKIRGQARLVLTNPDMLHVGILPNHTSWAEFFRRLDFVVIDEMHAYRGVFGSHVANVIRRLKRIAHFYGSWPQFILTSATIANPQELAEKLTGENVQLIEEDGSSLGEKLFLMYNPPVVDQDLGIRRSALHECVRISDDLLTYNLQTIIFGRSRHTVELILMYLRDKVQSNSTVYGFNDTNENPIRGYRSGYLPDDRREIERGLRRGDVRAVVATNALELGIDIGGMGAALLVGYPGSIAATWQQAGRAGRGSQKAVAIMIATADPLDQYLAHHPDYLFSRSPEHALINPDNLLILLDHLRCAVFEKAFQAGESFGGLDPEALQELLDILASGNVIHYSGDRYYWMSDYSPASRISLRSASAENVVLQIWDDLQPRTVGHIDRASAHWMVHPGAVYLHEGQSYIVEELDLENNLAQLVPSQTEYYTDPLNDSQVQVIQEYQMTAVPGSDTSYGELKVTTQVTGYRKVRWYTHETLGFHELDLPPTELMTQGYWLTINEATLQKLREQGVWSEQRLNYGPDWPEQRDKARARDGYRCQVCGVMESGRKHDVHHKVPLRAFRDVNGFIQTSLAHRLENLVTLCHTCHRQVETNVRIRSGLAGLAFTLGHLAPFFLMCDRGDIGVHSDPQSPISGGMPTIIIYDQIPAGIGFSRRLYEIHSDLMSAALHSIQSCPCTDGCPSCVGPGGENGAGGKKEAIQILKYLAPSD